MTTAVAYMTTPDKPELTIEQQEKLSSLKAQLATETDTQKKQALQAQIQALEIGGVSGDVDRIEE